MIYYHDKDNNKKYEIDNSKHYEAVTEPLETGIGNRHKDIQNNNVYNSDEFFNTNVYYIDTDNNKKYSINKDKHKNKKIIEPLETGIGNRE